MISAVLLSIILAFTEGILSNADNIESFTYNNQHSIENSLSDDAVKDYLISYINLYNHKPSDRTVLDSLNTYLSRGLYNRVLAHNPANFLEEYIQLIAYFRKGDLENASEISEKMKKYGNMSLDSILNIVDAAIDVKNSRKDSAYIKIMDYNDYYSNYIKALYFLELDKPDSALSILKGINNHKINHSSFVLITDIFINMENYNEALNYIENFEEEFKQSGKMPYMLYAKGYIYYQRGYFQRSIDVLHEMINIAKNSTLMGNALYLIGKNYFMLGDYSNMEKYLQYVKNDFIQSDFKKNALFLDGKGMFFNHEYKKAVEKLEEFNELYPDDFLTPYAYQILAQSYFYLEDYNKSLNYIESIDNPGFVVDKLVMMRYFIDYRNGIYADSISAYSSFLDNEQYNPMRKDVYEYIITHTDIHETELRYLKEYLIEFPDNEEFSLYFKPVIDYLVFYERMEDIYWFAEQLSSNQNPGRDGIFTAIIMKMEELEMDSKIIEFYSRFAEQYIIENKDMVYCVANILMKDRNYDEAELLFTHITESESIYADSSIIQLGIIFTHNHELVKLDKIMSELSPENGVYPYLLRNRGEIYHYNRDFERAVNEFLQSAELFGENRNEAALSLIMAAESALEHKDIEYCSILLQRASVLATDTEIVNKIKVMDDKIK